MAVSFFVTPEMAIVLVVTVLLALDSVVPVVIVVLPDDAIMMPSLYHSMLVPGLPCTIHTKLTLLDFLTSTWPVRFERNSGPSIKVKNTA